MSQRFPSPNVSNSPGPGQQQRFPPQQQRNFSSFPVTIFIYFCFQYFNCSSLSCSLNVVSRHHHRSKGQVHHLRIALQAIFLAVVRVVVKCKERLQCKLPVKDLGQIAVVVLLRLPKSNNFFIINYVPVLQIFN